MKLSKLMLSAFVAALAVTSCNKQEHTPEVNANMKTINISFQNAVMTKGDAGTKISNNSPVKVNNLKIFLTDESFSSEYSAMDESAANPAQFYWTSNTLATGEMKATFHFVDHKCTRVVAIANAGNISFEDLKGYSAKIGEQQKQESLVLLAFDELDGPDGVHEDASTGKYTEVYKAQLTLKPLISRFEIDGFSVAFTSPTPKFNKIEVTDVAFQNYYSTASVAVVNGVLSATGAGVQKPIEDPAKDAQVLPWFASDINAGWFRDSFTSLVMIPDDASTPESENRADCSPRAYHFFAGNLVPTLLIKLKADDQVSYVYTDKFRKSDAKDDYLYALEPGKIYRMKAAGRVADDGSIPIPDDDIDPIKRCLDITVEVIDWTVDLITPEF